MYFTSIRMAFISFHSSLFTFLPPLSGELERSWGLGGEAFTFHFLGRLRLEMKFKIKT